MIEDRHRVWYNPNQNDTWLIPISELLTVITVLAIMLPVATAVREKERGTIELAASLIKRDGYGDGNHRLKASIVQADRKRKFAYIRRIL